MKPTPHDHHPQDKDPPAGPVVLQLVGADAEADALANAMELRDDLETRLGRSVALIVLDPPPPALRANRRMHKGRAKTESTTTERRNPSAAKHPPKHARMALSAFCRRYLGGAKG